MKYLLTGGAGFVGASIARRLVNEGNEVALILKSTSNDWRIRNFKHLLKIYFSDLTDESAVSKAIKDFQPEVVYHVATHGVYPHQKNNRRILLNNMIITLNLLNACLKINLKMFVNTGSFLEYGFKDMPMKEADMLEPASSYAVSKAAQTLLAQQFSMNADFSIVTLRLFSVYGKYEGNTRLIPTLINNYLSEQSTHLVSPKIARDFVYIEDAVDLFLKIVNFPELNGHIFNCATGKETKLEEVVEMIAKLLNIKGKVFWNTFEGRSWDTTSCVGDPSKVNNLTGWKAGHSLERGLLETIKFFK